MPDEQAFDLYERYVTGAAQNISNTPMQLIDGGQEGTADDLLIVNYHALGSLNTNAELDAHEQDIETYVEVSGRRFQDPESPSAKNWLTNELFNEAANPAGALSEAARGSSYHNTIYLNEQLDGLSILTNLALGIPAGDPCPLAYTPQQEALYAEFVRYHEAAHAVLNLDEAGADFMAAAALLNRYPDSPDVTRFLEHMADLRVIGAARNPNMNSLSGIEAYDAFHQAIGLHNRGELPPVEDSESLFLIAEQYDQQNLANSVSDQQRQNTVYGEALDRINTYAPENPTATPAAPVSEMQITSP